MKILMYGAVIACLMASLATAENDPGISDVLSPDQIYATENIRSFSQSGTVRLAGLSGTFESCFKAPDKMYQSMDMGIMQMAQGCDGHDAWIRDANGQQVELTGMEYKSVMNSIYVMNGTFLKDKTEKPIYVGRDLIDGEPYIEFKAYPQGGDSVFMYVGELTGRLDMVKSYLDEISLITHFGDFRKIDGFEVSMKSWTESSNPMLNDTMIISEAKVNIDLPDSLFAMNPEVSEDFDYPPNLDSVVIPIVYEKGYIGFHAMVNDSVKALFILDSGAGMNALDKRFADKLGLVTSGELLAKGAAGYGQASITSLDSLEIGGVKFHNQKVAVIDFYSQNLRFGDDFGGLIGFDFISRFALKIDFSAKTLTVYNPDSEINEDPAASIPFRMMLKIPIIEASIGGCQGDFLFDLGNPLGIILRKAFLDSCKLDSSVIESKGNMQLGGVGGTTFADMAVGHDFRIGEVEVKTVPLVIAEGEQGLIRSTDVDGNIGTNFLEKFTVLLDYRGGRVYLLPGKGE